MVRTAIACARCRRSKVKCVHTGLAPCRACQKIGGEVSADCVLSGPVLHKRHTPRDPTSHQAGRPPRPRRKPSPVEAGPGIPHHAQGEPCYPDSASSAVPAVLALRAASAFSNTFPEISFLHMPGFRKLVRQLGQSNDTSSSYLQLEYSSESGNTTALCAALIAITVPLIEPELQRQHFAAIAKNQVSLDSFPDIYAVQTLLVLTIYEWGSGRPYQAWIYSGMATRMIQLIGSTPEFGSGTQLEQEIHNRTFWSCFILDKMVFCGKPQPPALPLRSVETYWPSRETDFVFGQPSSKTYPNDTHVHPTIPVVDDIDGYFTLLVQGFDIWSEILKWIVSGGRRHPKVVSSKEVPWMEGSTWLSAHCKLRKWRQSHGARIRFPEANTDAHLSLGGGNGEAFAYINLVYYLSVLFLCREYIPFLPTSTSRPVGPVDSPLIEETSPVGWWEDRASDLFSASANITAILRELVESETPLFTPFAGFCAFSAATMNIYVAVFPQMNLGRSPDSHADFESDLAYLDRFRTLWPMGAGWWATINRTKDLYQGACSDRSRFEGKTRNDFVALETSIHDCTGTSPGQDQALSPDMQSSGRQDRDQNYEHEAALSLQGLSASIVPGQQQLSDAISVPEWNEMWSLWGEHQLASSFTAESFSYDDSFQTALNFR